MTIYNILNEQFVVVSVCADTTPQRLMDDLIGWYPVLASVGWILTESDVCFAIEDGIEYGFSLNALRDRLGSRAIVAMYAPGMDD